MISPLMLPPKERTPMPLTDRVLSSIAKSRDLDRPAMRALMKATELLGLASGLELVRLRDSTEPLHQAYAQAKLEAIRTSGYVQLCQLLSERWEKLPRASAPSLYAALAVPYSGAQKTPRLVAQGDCHTLLRFGGNRHSLGAGGEYRKRIRGLPGRTSAARSTSRRCGEAPRPFDGLVWFRWQQTHRASPRPSRPPHLEANRRADSERKSAKEPSPELLQKETKPRLVSGKYPNHSVLIDITDIPGFFRLITFKLVVVLDVFSRMPLSWRVFPKEPTAVQVAAVVEDVARGPGAKHLISDQGSQFIASFF